MSFTSAGICKDSAFTARAEERASGAAVMAFGISNDAALPVIRPLLEAIARDYTITGGSGSGGGGGRGGAKGVKGGLFGLMLAWYVHGGGGGGGGGRGATIPLFSSRSLAHVTSNVEGAHQHMHSALLAVLSNVHWFVRWSVPCDRDYDRRRSRPNTKETDVDSMPSRLDDVFGIYRGLLRPLCDVTVPPPLRVYASECSIHPKSPGCVERRARGWKLGIQEIERECDMYN
jgi:hypothetical protein